MIEEALSYLYDKFTAAQNARLLNVPGSGRVAYVDQGGKLTPIEVTPPLRNHNVSSVDDLIEAAKLWKNSPVVWISGDAVVLLPDDSDRRDRVTMKLVKSAAFSKLCMLAKAPQISQADLVRMIRVDLQGTVNRAALLTAIRQIKFRQSTTGQASIQHGNESMGKTIEAEVTGAGDLPETVVVSCAVFSNPGEREKTSTVGCDLEIVVSDASFLFRPIPDEIERVTDAALEDIRERIESGLDGASVFFGSP